LQKAARGLPVTARRRDLFREPLTMTELAGFAAAIVDPPRAGAEKQSRMLAASAVPRIAYVSCNPTSFARDAAILTEGGYRLESVTPVDQFAWSPHVELTGLFRR
jgi:23S rRNA (uracil1939-C5)-methyltransferase